MTGREDVLVCVRGELAVVPTVDFPPGLTVREMDPADPAEVARWLEVHNAAFDRHWTAENHRLAMCVNPVLIVDRTYLVERDGASVATASIGRFRGNEAVGVGHYLGVHPSVQGQGLGFALCSHRYRALAAMGIERAETQTHLHRVASLRAHFRCGFTPKVGIDPWNSLVPTRGRLRRRADRRLQAIYNAWLSDR